MINQVYLNRLAEATFSTYVSSRKIVIVSGARQVGKTTLVKHCIRGQKSLFLNFDIEVDRLRFSAAASVDPASVCSMFDNPEILIVDEAQRLPEASRIVKGWYDAQVPMKIVLLGSSSLDLLAQSAESLTGRNYKLFLFPLLFEEAITSQSWYSAVQGNMHGIEKFATPLRVFLMQNIAYGSYPEIVVSDQKVELLRTLSSDYLYKDILYGGLIKTPELIRKLLQLLAFQVGREVSVSEIANQLHISRVTVERYLDFLEQTFVIFRLKAFSTNPRKEISKSQKIYFWDTGIRNALLNAFSIEPFRPDIGQVWENWVIAEIAKYNALHSFPWELYFWRSKSQSEVDLVVKQGTSLYAFEVKWKQKKVVNRSFMSAYGAEVNLLHPENPFVTKIVHEIAGS